MKALVIGAARSGSSVSKLLQQHGYQVYLTDSKTIKDKDVLSSLGVIVYDNGHPESLKDIDYDLIVKNPGIPYTVPFVHYFVEKGYFIYNEIDVAYQYATQNQYASITGTNGKTTTTAILEHMLKQENMLNCACGNIGLPLSEMVLTQKEPLKIAVEIAAFQLLGIKNYKPLVSTCTNLAPDHLDVFKESEKYYQAKSLVYQNQDENGWFIRNCDDEHIMSLFKDIPCKVIDFSLRDQKDLYLKNGAAYLFEEKLFEAKTLKLVGQHNLSNAMMAAAMARVMNVSIDHIQQAIATFEAVEHRIEFVKEIKGVRYYNDSKATTVESTLVALDAFDHPVILLAGGYDKKTGFELLKTKVDKIKKLYAFGDCKYQIKEIYPNTILCDTMSDALASARKIAEYEDIILLSPMCASYDQFDNYEQRGEQFKALVNKGDE